MGASITGAFGVRGETENGRRVVEFFAERGPCLGNTLKHKYIRVVKSQDGVKVKSMIDLLLVKKDVLHFGQ